MSYLHEVKASYIIHESILDGLFETPQKEASEDAFSLFFLSKFH